MNPYRLRVGADASTPSRPHADLTVTARVSADTMQIISLRLAWRDGAAVTRWRMQEGQIVRPGRRAGGIADPFGVFGGGGEEWQEDTDELDRGAHTTFPSVTTALRGLIGLAMAWEHAPVRSADKLLRLVQTLVHRAVEADVPKPPAPPPVDLRAPTVPEPRTGRAQSHASRGHYTVSLRSMATMGRRCPRCEEHNLRHVHARALRCATCGATVNIIDDEEDEDNDE